MRDEIYNSFVNKGIPPCPDLLKEVEKYEQPVKEGTLWYLIQTDQVQEFTRHVVLNNIDPEKEDIWIFNENFWSCIEFGVFCGSLNVVKYLTINNATIDLRVIRRSVEGGYEQTIEFLSEQGHSFDDLIYGAILSHHNRIGFWILENYENDTNRLISESVYSFNTEMFLFFLLEQGRSINETSYYPGKTPLIHSVESNNIPLVRFILSQEGVDVTPKDNEGKTALEYSEAAEIKEMISCFII